MSNANAVAKAQNTAPTVEQVLIKGDLSGLPEQDRIRYYHEVCKSVGLNPLTQPFAYITLNGKLTLYALRACTDQLRSIYGVSVEELAERDREGLCVVTVKVRNKDGRTDMATGAVNINGLKGESLANALMKAETKAKRRATLSICGLGMLDESELDTIPDAKTSRSVPSPSLSHVAPQKVEPPHDPQTGELSPHAIAVGTVNGKMDWVGWGGKLIAAFKASTSVDELVTWLTTNEATLDNCREVSPKAHGSIMGAYQKCYQAFPTVPDELIDAEIVNV